MTTGAVESRKERGATAQAVGLAVLVPICAEYLAAYDSSTGNPAELLGGLLVLVPLYGCAALLIREVARRANLGWVGIFLMAAAFGLLQAGVVDQSLFSVDYRGISDWDEGRRLTLVEPLGISAAFTINFIQGHMVAICASIALIEALQPQRRHLPWLGRIGVAATALLYVGASVLILVYHLRTERSHASPLQVTMALLVVGALVVAAFLCGRRAHRRGVRRAPWPWLVFVVSLIAFATIAMAPEGWSGVARSLGVLAVGSAALLLASAAGNWDARHEVAVAVAPLLCSALLAFTYFPVIGKVEPLPKYLHNATLLVMVLVLWALAAWRAKRAVMREA